MLLQLMGELNDGVSNVFASGRERVKVCKIEVAGELLGDTASQVSRSIRECTPVAHTDSIAEHGLYMLKDCCQRLHSYCSALLRLSHRDPLTEKQSLGCARVSMVRHLRRNRPKLPCCH